MELFDSYRVANVINCDVTEPCEYPDPNARILCVDIRNTCGQDCTKLILENGLILCDCGDSWNCKLCLNDVPFWVPFETGDTIDFQFQQPDEIVGVECENGWLPTDLLVPGVTSFATFEIRSCCDDQALEITEEMFGVIAPNHYVGNYTSIDYAGNQSTNPIQLIRFNLAAIQTYMVGAGLDPCFYFLFTFTATRQCLGVTEATTEFCSEPFKMVPCSDGEKTQLVESVYPRTDCFGFYYGTNFTSGNGTPFAYSNKIRVPGSFERTNFTITKETIGATLRTTAAQYCETWLLRTSHLPETFVKYLVNVFTGRDVFVNGTEYQIQGEISKNNEIGSQWFLETTFERCECDKSLTCE
jgi:hypothetical protein